MQDVFDFWWIIYATIAVVIFVKLRSVLGQRTGRERPPYDPYSARDTATRDTVRPSTNDNVVALPGRTAEPVPKPADSDGPGGGSLERPCGARFTGGRGPRRHRAR